MANNEQNHIDPEKIHLLKIEPLEVLISNLEKPFDINEPIDMKIAHLSAHNLNEKKFLMGLDIILTLLKRETENTARFRYDFHFNVDNLEEMYSLNENEEPTFKKQFGATLAGISYTTLRGIIFEKLYDSSWSSIIIPVIDPNKILESWIEV